MKTKTLQARIGDTVIKLNLNYERGSNQHDLCLQLGHYIPARSWTMSVALWWVSAYLHVERAGIDPDKVMERDWDKLLSRIADKARQP